MIDPRSPFSFGLPARISEIESRFGPARPRTSPTATTGAADFEALLAAETSRLGDSGSGPGPAAALTTGSTLGSALFPDLPNAQPQTSVPGEAVVEAAKAHLGVPYLWGGTDPGEGFDCSGLLQAAYQAIGVEIPKWSRHQATMGVEVDGLNQALPGDVLAFGHPVNHVALYIGDGLMVHAPRTGEVVKIEPVDRPIASIRRIVTPSGGPVAEAAPALPTGPGLGEAELRYQPLFEAAGRRWSVDPGLLAAVAEAESGFDPSALSPAGAQGLMQFMAATAAEMGVDPWDPASAIDGAARYLRTSLDRFGSADLAIASYNAGRGAVARYGGVPPFPETRNYVREVLNAWRARS